MLLVYNVIILHVSKILKPLQEYNFLSIGDLKLNNMAIKLHYCIKINLDAQHVCYFLCLSSF